MTLGYTIETVKEPIYTNTTQFEEDKKNIVRSLNAHQCIHGHCKKTRGICLDGVLKNTNAKRITLNLDYLKHIKEVVRKKKEPTSVYNTHRIYMDDIIADIFPNITAGDLYVKVDHFWEPVSSLDAEDKYNDQKSDEYADYNSNTFTFDVYETKDFVKLPPSQKELDIIAKEEQRKNTEKFNSAFLQDTIITAVKQKANIDLETTTDWHYKNRKYIRVTTKDWAKLVTTAINHYLNDIVKEHNLVLPQPKLKNNMKIDCYKPLVFIDEIQMKENKNDRKESI